MPSSEQKSVVTIRISGSMKASLQKAADEKGGNLSAEILHRLTEYESVSRFVDRLLDDSAAITVAVSFETLRKGTIETFTGSLDESLPSLERAIATAACISNLFETVADHVGDALTEKTTASLTESFTRRREAGDHKEGFDIVKMAPLLSAEIVKNAKKCGRSFASSIAPTIGPYFWDVCFDKDDPLRSAPLGKGHGLMGTLAGSSVGLPPSFIPPLPTEEERLASMKELKESVEIRDAAKHRMREGQYPGMSEEEAIDRVYDDLLKPFGMEPSEANPDAPTS